MIQGWLGGESCAGRPRAAAGAEPEHSLDPRRELADQVAHRAAYPRVIGFRPYAEPERDLRVGETVRTTSRTIRRRGVAKAVREVKAWLRRAAKDEPPRTLHALRAPRPRRGRPSPAPPG
jgi:hypothetical protein